MRYIWLFTFLILSTSSFASIDLSDDKVTFTKGLDLTVVDCSKGNVCSGSYTFTTSGYGGGITSCQTNDTGFYLRVDDFVWVAGRARCTFNGATGDSLFEISLPFASDLTNGRDCTGTAGSGPVSNEKIQGVIFADTTDETCQFNMEGGGFSGTDRVVGFSLIYQIR